MYHPDVALFFQTPWSQAGAGLACDPGLRMGGDRNRSREGLMAPPPTSDVMTRRAFPSAPHVRGAGGQGAWAAHRAPPPPHRGPTARLAERNRSALFTAFGFRPRNRDACLGNLYHDSLVKRLVFSGVRKHVHKCHYPP